MVSTENLGRIIDEHPFFKGIPASLRDLLVGCAKNERFEAGQYLFKNGGKADRFFLVRGGTVAVEIDVSGREPIVIETVGDGEVLGWSWIVPPHISAFDARAMTLVRALSFDAKCLLKKMEADPALGYAVLRRFVPMMAHRLQASRLQMLDLYGPGDLKPAKPPKVKVEKAVKDSKGKNRSPAAALAKPEKPLKAAKPKADKPKKAAKKTDKPKKLKKAG